MGLAVLIDQENCLNFLGLRCDVCYRVCPVIDKAITLDPQTNEPVVSITFDTQGGAKFAKLTSENVNRPFAIILDGKVLSAPNINEPILGGSAQISGSFTTESANQLAIALQSITDYPLRNQTILALAAFAGLLLFFHAREGWVPILDSANLAFHEAGHPLFGLVSSRLMVYGGTFMQLLLPLTAAWQLHRQQQRWHHHHRR